MGTHDSRVDAYIAKSADFARPILEHLRAVVHDSCPDVEETMKWGFPHFTHHGMLCHMASFKQHCAFGFWKAKELFEPGQTSSTAMGDFGRISQINDLPSKTILKRLIKQAAQLNLQTIDSKTTKKPVRTPEPELPLPEVLSKAFDKNKQAKTVFENFSASHRREYIEWIAEAKREETVQKRVNTTIEQLMMNKPLHWKYQSR